MTGTAERENWSFRLIAEESLCVIIPTYNNAATVGDVIVRTSRYVRNIIVVNDGSTDGTDEILHGLESSLSITVITLPANKGKGRALVTGFETALAMGFRYAVTIDSDGQHYPEDIPLLIAAEERNIDSIIVGSRNLEGKEISGGSLFANKFSNFWLCVQTGRSLPDTQTGFRLYPLHKLRGMHWITSRYEAELELIVYAAWHGVKVVPVEVDVYYPPREERVSHFRPFRDFARISILNTFLCIGALLYGYPMMLLRFLRAFVYSLYSLLVFVISSFALTLWALISFNISRKNIEDKKLKLHRIIWRFAKFASFHIPGVKCTYDNPQGETFEKPSLIICNHQSHLDLMFTMMLTPKMVILTNDWVWNNPIYSRIIRYADFLPVSYGMENTLPRLEELVARGYSILVFPEGTRSEDCSVLHFQKGAFYLAEQLKLDIMPVFLYGSGLVLPKKSLLLKKGKVCIVTGKRISQEDRSFGTTFRSRARAFEKLYAERLEQLTYEHINGVR